MKGRERQTAIYLNGVFGRKPKVPTDATKLQEAAERVLTPEAYAYIAAGAGTEGTLEANRKAFDRWRIVPRMLRDVSERDNSVELFGRRIPSPFLTAPVGVLELAHRDADLAVARAARSQGVPMIISGQASTPMEEIARELGDSPRWFQLYWATNDEFVESLVQRAEACGCDAIAVTLDTIVLGWRPRDLDPAYLPFLQGKGIAQYTSDPVFRRLLDEPAGDGPAPRPRPSLTAVGTLISLLRRYPDRAWSALRSGRAMAAPRVFTDIYSRPTLTWKDLAWLRERTKLPILLKGILHPEDAKKAVDAGMNGVIVSNHGGRQVDGSISTFEALPGVADAVGDKVPVILDSGVRGGADAFKAIALGARAVAVGRPYVYGLAIAGELGVREVLENLMADFDITMGLSGHTRVADIGPDALARPA